MLSAGHFTKLFTALVLLLQLPEVQGAGQAGRVVVMVWDGMRPDFVSEQTTPNLFRLEREGVTFKRHHAVFVSATEVNGTALATGMYPEKSGLIGNKEFRPALDTERKTQTESLAAIRKGDELSGNHYLKYPTIAELLHGAGRRTAVAGTKGVAILQDRLPRSADGLGMELFEGETMPPGLGESIVEHLGKFPKVSKTSPQADIWTTEALTGPLWDREVPAFSVLWMSQPDYSQHETGPGSTASLAAIRSADENLGRVLAALEAKKLRGQTDVIVVSDHGFSTIVENTDVQQALEANGFAAYRDFKGHKAREGDILVVGNSGSVFLYVIGHEERQIEKVARFLQRQRFCGAVITRQPVEGAFGLKDALVNSADAPDIVISMRWRADASTNGTPGLLYLDYSEHGPGQGTHGSLSRFDLHNTCVAAGPDFRRGFVDELPTGNVDIAPTVLSILGIEPAQKQSGRVLREALVDGNGDAVNAGPGPKPHHLEASSQKNGFRWEQYLDYTEYGGVIYLEEGNGDGTEK